MLNFDSRLPTQGAQDTVDIIGSSMISSEVEFSTLELFAIFSEAKNGVKLALKQGVGATCFLPIGRKAG
jgi:hypothetical protein